MDKLIEKKSFNFFNSTIMIGAAFLLYYICINILKFYGVDTSQYSIYIGFYIFLLITYFVL